MSKKDDSLFLLEVLIDKIVFTKSPCFTDKDFRTCVNIECSTVESLEICDDEPGINAAKSEGPFAKTFNSGKSCLFSLKESEIAEAMSKFPIKVSVYKSLPCGCLPTKIIMGEATIDMTKEFVQARNKFLDDPNSVSYQALKDSFRIVGEDGTETGEIIMFLRISCFGKLIVTKFQGASGSPNLKTGGASATIDRSCLPQRDYQTAQDPCVCGATRKAGAVNDTARFNGPSCTVSEANRLGVCPPGRDPFNSMPCEEFDDPCYCSGPKSAKKEKMICRNTDQYCLHVPKGTLLHSSFEQDMVKMKTTETRSTVVSSVLDLYQKCLKMQPGSEMMANCERAHWLTDSSVINVTNEVINPITGTADLFSNSSTCTMSAMKSEDRSVSFSETIDYFWKLQNKNDNFSANNLDILRSGKSKVFGKNETTVYMTLCEDFGHHQNAGTQATGSINKCLQISRNKINFSSYQKVPVTNLNTNLLYLNNKSSIRNTEVYFFGKKKNSSKLKKGMGSQASITKLYKRENVPSNPSKSKKAISTQAKSASSSVSMQTKKLKQAAAGASSSKTVSIKTDTQKPCPAIGTVKGDMMVTVSHIKISPKQPCPIHGKDPCQGPKCIAAASQEEHAPVKVTTVNNPRRGVFELVIRKMTGAPLARNELMLEWTPPPCRAPPCPNSSGPYPPKIYRPATCRVSKYKLISCRPSSCRQKCYKPKCRKSCVQPPVPCLPLPCKRCYKPSCCGKCSLSRPCSPIIRCAAPIPSTCKSPCPPALCYKNPCRSPCLSSPCLRPCPVGRRRPRRARSQPKIKEHKKRISPCLNKAKVCPFVGCRSKWMPCINCCSLKPCYSRRHCSFPPSSLQPCSSSPCSLPPCKSLGYCKSCCSINCE